MDAVKIYVDGSSIGNPGDSGIGVVVVNGEVKEYSKKIGKATNNVAELTAVKYAIEKIGDKNKEIYIYTDSQYVIGMLSLNWVAKANQKLIREIKEFIKDYKVTFIKVSGHSSDEYNRLADKLAYDAASS